MSKALLPARLALTKAASRELPAYVRYDEVHRALELSANKPRVRSLVWFLWITGARISEALGCHVGDIDFRGHVVTLTTLKRKARTVRTVPITAPEFLGELAVLINAYHLVGTERLFPWRSRSYAFELVRDQLIAAGVEAHRARPHALRHGHAVHALENRAPLNAVQRVLGHANITTTNTYLAVTGEDVRRYYEGIKW